MTLQTSELSPFPGPRERTIADCCSRFLAVRSSFIVIIIIIISFSGNIGGDGGGGSSSVSGNGRGSRLVVVIAVAAAVMHVIAVAAAAVAADYQMFVLCSLFLIWSSSGMGEGDLPILPWKSE